MLRAASLLLAFVALAWAGCGSNDPAGAPSACLAGPGGYLGALREAPSQVRLDGSTPISDCPVPEQGGGELADVGAVTIATAARLNAQSRRDPAGPSALQLGYLVGALERGSEDTSGIHADLIRRINAAAQFSPGGAPLPVSFERSYRRGSAAGHEDG